MIRNPYYGGRFEFPRGSSIWFKVAHESIVTEELYEQVQQQLTLEKKRPTWGAKEFAFTRLMKCGSCGCGITAQDKFKTLRDGTRQRYVYYHCSGTAKGECKEPYIREEQLIEQMVGILGDLDIDRSQTKREFDEEICRHQKLMEDVLGKSGAAMPIPRLDHKSYLRHVLTTGTKEEKRELLSCIKSTLVLNSRKITLQKCGT